MLEEEKKNYQSFWEMYYESGKECGFAHGYRRAGIEVGLRIIKFDANPKERSNSFSAELKCSREGRIPGEDLEELEDLYAFWERYGSLSEEKIAERVMEESEFFHVGDYGLFYGDRDDPQVTKMLKEEEEKMKKSQETPKKKGKQAPGERET